MNLLEETFEALDRNHRKPNEVLWVGAKDWSTDFATFARFAKEIEYDPGYGIEEIVTSLVVVGEDWWLERATYDGSEWWAYKSRPWRTGINDLTDAKQLTSEWAYLNHEEKV